jgi:hypothetical protein
VLPKSLNSVALSDLLPATCVLLCPAVLLQHMNMQGYFVFSAFASRLIYLPASKRILLIFFTGTYVLLNKLTPSS